VILVEEKPEKSGAVTGGNSATFFFDAGELVASRSKNSGGGEKGNEVSSRTLSNLQRHAGLWGGRAQTERSKERGPWSKRRRAQRWEAFALQLEKAIGKDKSDAAGTQLADEKKNKGEAILSKGQLGGSSAAKDPRHSQKKVEQFKKT